MPEAEASPVISYQARSYNVFDEQTKDARYAGGSREVVSADTRRAASR